MFYLLMECWIIPNQKLSPMQQQTLDSEIRLRSASWGWRWEGCKWITEHTNGEHLMGWGLMPRLGSHSPKTDRALFTSLPMLVILVVVWQVAVFASFKIALSKKWWTHQSRWKVLYKADEMITHGCHKYPTQVFFNPTCNDKTKRNYVYK